MIQLFVTLYSQMFSYRYVVRNNLTGMYDKNGHFIVRTFKRNFFSKLTLFIFALGNGLIRKNVFDFLSTETENKLITLSDKPAKTDKNSLCKLFEFGIDY